MRLCDEDIERFLDQGVISITPRPANEKINGATVDVRLGNSFRVFREHSTPYIDLSGPREEMAAQLEQVMSEEILIADNDAFFYIRGNWHWQQPWRALSCLLILSAGLMDVLH